jgi:hypothetical protein
MTNYRGTNQMHRACGLRMLPAKGGNDSRLRLPRSFAALVVPLLGTETGSQQDSQSISSGSRTSQVLIQTEDHGSTVKEKSMSKFKIEKGVSRVARVKVQALIEKSIAVDLLLMSEWSNNDKNYVVNQLLRFVLWMASFRPTRNRRVNPVQNHQQNRNPRSARVRRTH